jgi:gliding motility-associated-like protein
MIQRLRLWLVLLGSVGTMTFAQAQSSIFFPPQTTNPTCNGSTNGSIVFAFQGDSSEFFFSWSGGNLPTQGNPTSGNGIVRQTGLQAGTYSVFVLDLVSGFDTTVQVGLTNSQPITVNGGNDVSNCLGQPISLSASTTAGSGSQFVWTYTNANGPQSLNGQSVVIPANPSPLALTTTSTVTVLVTDPSGCTATDQVLVTVNTPPVGQANPSSGTICTGPVSIALTNNQPNTSFIWTVSQSGATGATAGSGSQINQNLRTTGLTNGTVTYNIRPVSTGGCVGSIFQSVITVKPKPIITATPDSSSICSGTQTNIALNGNLSPISFAWRAIDSQTSGAGPGTGASISQTLNSGTLTGKVVYRIAGTSNGCVSDSIRVVVDVLPRPTVNVLPSDTLEICSGQTATFNYASVPAGASFAWTADPNTAGAVSGTGALNAQTLTNSGNQTLHVQYSVQAVLNGCSSLIRAHRVRVLPLPQILALAEKDSLCSGDTSSVSLSSNLSATSFSWTSVSNGVSGAGSGNGNRISDVLNATGSGSGTVTYSIQGLRNGCLSETIEKVLTVLPRPDLQVSPTSQNICSGETTSFSLSSSTTGAQFNWTVVSNGVQGAGSGSGPSISQTLVNPNPGLDSVLYQIETQFEGCAGETGPAVARVQTIAAPVANPARPEICSGSPLSVSLSPAGTWFWIPESSGVNGAVSGSGTSLNANLSLPSAQDDSVTYRVFGTQNGCTSDTLRLTVLVHANPVPGFINAEDTLCSGETASIQWTSQPADQTSFSWTAQANNVVGATGGTGANVNQVLNLSAGNAGTVIYTVTALRKGCSGQVSDTLHVVNPNIPFTALVGDQIICNGDTAQISFSSSSTGLTYSWSMAASNVTGTGSGTGNISQILQLQNPGLPGFADYTIVPKQGSCNGLSQTIRISVEPFPASPVITLNGGTSPICPGQSITLTSSQNFNNQWFRNGIAVPAPEGIAGALVVQDSGNYQVQFTTAAGCAAISSITRIDLLAVPETPVITGPAGICTGGTARLRSSLLSQNQWQLNGADIAGATDTIFVASLAGTYSVRVTGIACTVVSAPFEIQVFPNPVQPEVSGNNFVCAGDTGLLSSTLAATYQWIRNGSQIAGATNPILAITQGGNYQVRISDANGCTSVSNIFNVQSVGANPIPLISGNPSFCPGDSTILTSNNLNPAWKNQWFRDGNLLPGDSLRTLVVKQAGVYVVSLTSPRGCVSFSAPDTVRLRETPPVPTISGLGLVCTGNTTELTSSALTGNQWFLEGNPVAGANANTLDASQTGNYTVQVTNEQGCKALSLPFVLGTVSEPSVVATLTDPGSCGAATGSISLNVTGGSGAFRFVWSPLSGGIVQGASGQTALQAGNYAVLVTDTLSGCSQSISGMVLNDPASFTATTQVTNVSSCSGANGRIDLTVSGANGPLAFAWSGPVSGTTQNLINIPAGYYSVQITETATGCIRILDSILVNNNQPPKPDILASGPLEFCAGDSIQLSTTSEGPYQWARIGSGALAGQTFDTLVVKTSGLYYVRIANPAFPGCFSRSDTLLVTVNPLPGNPQVSGGNTNLCQGVTTSITTTSNLTKQWLKDGIEIPGATGSFIEVGEAGVYCLQVTDANGCSRVGTNCRTVIVNPNPPSPVIEGNPGFCSGSSTILEVVPFDSLTYNYTWLRNNNFTGQNNQRRLTVNLEGWYKIRLVNEQTSCRTFSDSVFVTNHPNPVAPTISGPGSICPGGQARLISSQAQTYQWFRNGQILNGETTDTLNISQSGVYTVGITDANGCASVSAGFVVSEISAPVASTISGPSEFCAGASVILTATSNTNYKWLFNGIALLNQTNQTLSASLFGNYQVVVTNLAGCSDTSASFLTTTGVANFTLDTLVEGTQCVSGQPANNGSIVVTTIGGSGNFTYEWTPTLPPVANPGQLSPGIYAVAVKDQSSGCMVTLQNLEVTPTPTIEGSPFITDDSRCDLENGSISVIASGGTAPYQFEWNGFAETGNTLSGLGAGSYEVTVTDPVSGCSATLSNLTVSGVDTFEVQATLTQPASCGGQGLIALALTGGSGQFSYAWSGTGTGLVQNSPLQSQLSSGTYAVQISDTVSRCSRSLQNLVLEDSGNLDFEIVSQNPANCGGADGQAAVVIGIPAIYQWKVIANGSLLGTDSLQTGLVVGQYRVVITAGTCIDSADVDINSPGLAISATTNPVSACGETDGSITLSLDRAGVNPQFSWTKDGLAFASSQNLSGLAAGQYKVMVQSAECLDSLVSVLNGPAGIVVVASIDTASDCQSADGGISLTAGPEFTQLAYQWFSLPGRNPVGNGGNQLTGVSSGNYRVILTNGLCQDSADYTIPAGNQPTLNVVIQNPTFCSGQNGRITVTDSAQFSNAVNLQVQWLNQGNPIGNQFTISGLSAGNYDLRIQTGNEPQVCLFAYSFSIEDGTGLGLTAVSDSSDCQNANGSATVSAQALLNNPAFSWTKQGDPGFTASGASQNNLSAGTYKVRVQSGLCLDSVDVTIFQKTDCGPCGSISISFQTQSPQVCGASDGQIIAQVSGLSNPQYAWKKMPEAIVVGTDDTLSNVAGGLYRLVVSDGVCSDSADALLENPVVFVLTTEQDSASCADNDGSITVQLLNGSPSAVYGIFALPSKTLLAQNQPATNLASGTYRIIGQDGLCTDSVDVSVFKPADCDPPVCTLSVSASGTAPTSCGLSDGTVLASFTGGTNPVLTWFLLPSSLPVGTGTQLNNLSAGLYRVIATEGLCADTAEVNLPAPVSFTTTFETDSASCADNDGAITLTLTGGSGTFGFNWTKIGTPGFSASSQNLSNLASGVYKVVITDGQCRDSLFIPVRKPAQCGGCALQVIATSQPATCNGVSNGTAFAFVTSGGTGPFEYRLNNNPGQLLPDFLASFTNQPTGPFTVIVEDQFTFCSDTVNGFIGSQLALTASAFTQNPGCGTTSGSIRVVAAGGTGPFSFTLGSQTLISASGDTTFTGLPAGTYSVSVSNGQGCTSQINGIELTSPEAVSVVLGSGTPATCNGNGDGSMEIVSLSGAGTYSYLIPELGTTFLPLTAGTVLENLFAGTYNLIIRGAGACDLDTTFVINQPTAVDANIGQIQNSACLDSTGSVKIISLQGGVGAPWTHGLYRNGSLQGDGPVPSDSTFTGLKPGAYTLVVLDANFCSDTIRFNIGTQTLTPVVGLTASASQICSGDTVRFLASNTAGIPQPAYTWFLNQQVLNVSGSQIEIDTLAPGDSVFVALSGPEGCLSPDSAYSSKIRIEVLPANLEALAVINPVKVQACIGQSAILKALNPNQIPQPGYRWIINGVVLPNDTNETLTLFPGLPVNQVRLILFSRLASACITKNRDTSDVILVTQLQGFTATDSLKQISPAPGQVVCPNSPVVFAVKSNVKGKTAITVQWFRNDTLVASGTDTSFTFQGLPTGLVRIRAHVSFDTSLTCVTTNAGPGLDSTRTQSIQVLPAGDIRCQPCALQATVTPSNINCAGVASGAITVSASGGSGGYKYSLLPSGPANQAFPFFFGLTPGTYSILVRDTVTGCTRTVSGINLITQNAYSVVVSGTNPSACATQPDGKLEFVSITDGSGDLNKYKFRIRNTDPYTTIRIFTGLPSGTYNMEVIDTLTGCTTILTRTLAAPAQIQAVVAIGSQPACYGENNGQLVLDTVLNGSGFYQFSLSGEPGSFQNVSVNAAFPVGFSAGLYSIYIRDLQSGCIDTISQSIGQPDSLTLDASTLIGSECYAPTGQIRLKKFQGGTGVLNLSMKLPGATQFLPVVLPVDSILVNLIGGDYLFRLTDQNNCTKEILVNVPNNGPRSAQIQLTKPCRNDSNGVIRLTGLSGGTAPYTFTLRNDQGEILKVQQDTVFGGLKAGTYSIAMQDNSSPACEIIYTRTLDVPEKIRFEVVGFTPSTCENFDGVARFVIRGGQAPYRYSIDSLPGQFTPYRSLTTDTLILNGLSARAPEQLYQLRILDNGPGNGCLFDTLFNVPGDSPLRFRHSFRQVKCYGETSGAFLIDSLNGTGPIRIQVREAGSGVLVKEDSIPGSFFLNSQFEVGGIPAGTFNIVLLQYGNCSGSRSFDFTLTQPSRIEIFAREYKPSASGFDMGSVLLDSIRGSVKPWQVSFNEGNEFAYVPDTLFDGLDPGSYQIVVRDSIGCQVDTLIEVRNDPKLFIPTLFTPNQDGVNDRFEIRNLPAGSALAVKNRWGEEVFKSDPYQNDWDAKDLPAGTYFWVLTIPGQDSRNGWIEVQR